jgi:hypothetical protein
VLWASFLIICYKGKLNCSINIESDWHFKCMFKLSLPNTIFLVKHFPDDLNQLQPIHMSQWNIQQQILYNAKSSHIYYIVFKLWPIVFMYSVLDPSILYELLVNEWSLYTHLSCVIWTSDYSQQRMWQQA